jgi:hypothetical protein
MAWEDDELAGYEERQVAASQYTALSSKTISLLEQRHTQEWLALRSDVLDLFHIINQKASRDITTSLTPRVSELWIRREDGVDLKARYVAETKTATFSCEAPPFEEISFELAVRPVDGAPAVVWRTVGARPETISRDAATKQIVSSFLHAGTLI